MNFSKISYVSGALLGITGVIAGALGAHALEGQLSPDSLDSFETAVRFQMYHAFFLLMLGLINERHRHTLIHLSILGALTGILLFSGSIYLLVFTTLKVGIITPIGGMILILSWSTLFFWAIAKAQPFT